MDVKEAKYILAVARYKNINRAAKALYISQPSLSKYLQNLEYRLNTKLFSRVRNEYVPTYVGRHYLACAKRMMEISREWEAEYQDLMDVKKGRLNIAIPMVRSSCIIPNTIGEFHKRYPHVNVNIFEDTHSVEEMLSQDESIDLAIYNVNVFPKHLDYQILGQSEIVLVVPNNHPVIGAACVKKGFRHPWVDIRKLEEENFVLLYQEQTTGQLVYDMFKELEMSPYIWMQTRNSEVAIRMALNEGGVTLAAEGYFEYADGGVGGTCLSVGKSQMYTTMIAAYRKGQYLPEYQQDYIEIIKKEVTI